MANLNAIGRAVSAGAQPYIKRKNQLTYLQELGEQQIAEETFRKKLQLKQMIDVLTERGGMDEGQAGLLAAAKQSGLDPKWLGLNMPLSPEETAEHEQGLLLGEQRIATSKAQEARALRPPQPTAASTSFASQEADRKQKAALEAVKIGLSKIKENTPSKAQAVDGTIIDLPGNPTAVNAAIDDLLPAYEALGWETSSLEQLRVKPQAQPLLEEVNVPFWQKIAPGKQETEITNDIAKLEKQARTGNTIALQNLIKMSKSGDKYGKIAYQIIKAIQKTHPEYFSGE